MSGSFFADCRYAVRIFVRSAGTSSMAVVVLAVAMAFVAAFLSLYTDLAFRPYPGLEGSSRIVTIGQTSASRANSFVGVAYGAVDRMAVEMTSIDGAAFVAGETMSVDGVQTALELVSREFFRVLRPRLALGRAFEDSDHRSDAEPVAVISHRLWRDYFQSDPNVLGTTMEVAYFQRAGRVVIRPEEENAQFRVVGVMAEAVQGLVSPEAALWLPVERAVPLIRNSSEQLPGLSGAVFARRHAGTSPAAVVHELRSRYETADLSMRLLPGTRLDAIDGIVYGAGAMAHKNAQRQLEQFLAGSILIALAAAANVSLFLLSRAPGRRRELGIRMAVGAPLRRLARQLATEAGLLVVVSASLGLLASIWVVSYLRGLPILREAKWGDVTLFDWRVLALVSGLLLVLGLFVSLAPVLGLRRLGIARLSHQIASQASLAQRLAGTIQIAVAGAFAAAAIALAWHLGSLTDPGYKIANRYIVDGASSILGPDVNEEIFIEFARRRDAIEAIPGVSAVAFGSPVPGERLSGFQNASQIPSPADATRIVEAFRGTIDSRYIDVLGLRLRYGRAPTHGEAGVVVVNQALARSLWGRDSVVGERLPRRPSGAGDEASDEVIGVLEDLSFEHPSASAVPYVFSTLADPVLFRASIVIEADLTAAELQAELDRISNSGALGFQASNVRSLERLRADLTAPDRARSYLTFASAALVLFLAGYGLYGTQRFLVAAGRREYAIRASLGAGPRSLGRLVLRRNIITSLPGLFAGGLFAFIVAHWLQGSDFISRSVSPTWVTTWVIAGLFLLCMAACLAPAMMARRTQPATLLRED